jgi:hypothetical protein
MKSPRRGLFLRETKRERERERERWRILGSGVGR